MYSYDWLCRCMKNRTSVTLCAGNAVYKGFVNSIALEDGSGQNWLVTLALIGGGVKTVFVKAD